MIDSPEAHSISRSLLLHLAPGAAIALVYLTIGLPLASRWGQPSLVALAIAVLVALVPWQLGGLLWLGARRTGRASLAGVVLYRERTPIVQRLLWVLLLGVWATLIAVSMGGVDAWVRTHVFGWIPAWYELEGIALSSHPMPVRWLIFAGNLALFGLAAPLVEELYFRGYLLPRMARFGAWAPVANWALFSLYHMWTPWLGVSRFVFGLPIALVVQRRRDITIGMWTHCLLNSLGIVLGAMGDLAG